MKLPLTSLFLCACALQAQPYINYRGIVNGASYTPPGPIGSQIAQGSVFSIFGSGLGPAALVQVSSFPLQPALAGVSVKITQGSTTVNALPIFVLAGQVDAIMPSNAPLGQVSVRLTYNGATSNPVTATVAQSSFGIFAANSAGFGPGILQNFISQTNQPINSLTATAAPGQAISLWGTGLGPVSADNVAPTPGNLPTQVEVFVAGQPASILYSGRAPCCSGIDQIVFTVPNNAPLGCYVPVQIRTAQTRLSNSVTMAIQNGGAPCSDPANPISAAFIKGGKVGVAVLSRFDAYVDVDTTQPAGVTNDVGEITVRTALGGQFFFNPSISLPPAGSCITYTISGNPPRLTLPDFFGGLGMELDAGPNVSVSGISSVSIPRAAASPFYAAALGTNDPAFGASTLVLNSSGTTAVSAAGGTGVGAFNINIPAPPALSWTNRLQIVTIDRTQALPVTWTTTGLSNTLMIIGGSNYDLPSNTQRSFVCTAPGGAGSFGVPAYILQAIPASRPNVGQSTGSLTLGALPQDTVPFAASGLDTGLAIQLFFSTKTVLFQ
jgi:uncharacterized protein (TIGR03437 family)